MAGRDYAGINEILEMTSGERKCWNVTILDDSMIDEIDVERFYLYLYPQYASLSGASARVHITDNDGGMWKLSEVGGLIVHGTP